MSWIKGRPEGWENGWDTEREYDGMCSKAEIFEAGADAILEALKQNGVRITEETRMVTAPIFEQGNGYLVFIPDEE